MNKFLGFAMVFFLVFWGAEKSHALDMPKDANFSCAYDGISIGDFHYVSVVFKPDTALLSKGPVPFTNVYLFERNGDINKGEQISVKWHGTVALVGSDLIIEAQFGSKLVIHKGVAVPTGPNEPQRFKAELYARSFSSRGTITERLFAHYVCTNLNAFNIIPLPEDTP